MPTVEFEALPDSARVWVFAADRPVRGEAAERLLEAVDQFLAGWMAHGHPLVCAREWRDDHFLMVGVDQSEAYASGCSIDGLFRSLRALEPQVGASLVGGGRVFYRDAGGAVRSVSRDEFAELGRRGEVGPETVVLDPTVQTLGEWFARFEARVADSWHAQLL
ncbi:MAG: hypothetical protein ACJ8AO_00200 [Gemmatimonadaceae bacterium]